MTAASSESPNTSILASASAGQSAASPEESLAPAISLEAVDLSYRGRVALEAVSFDVPQGSFTALIGPNGAGKTTILRILLGLLEPDGGAVTLFGHPSNGSRVAIGYVPQRMQIPAGFPLTVHEAVLMGRYGELRPGRKPGRQDHILVRSALDRVGLAHLERERFVELSSGQQQRALIARALAGAPRLLLLDEPTAELDPAAQARFYALVCDLQHGEGLTLLCASHDLEVVSAHADRVVLIDRTVRAVGTPTEVLGSEASKQAYAFPPPHEHEPESA